MNRLGCSIANVWAGLWALWDGPYRAGELGWKVAPRFGTFIDLMSCYFLPFLFASLFGTAGTALGTAAFFGSLFEAVAQLFLSEPYKMPISRILVDWIPTV